MSFILNTDGLDVCNVPGAGKMWPVYLAINELPPTKRYESVVCGQITLGMIMIALSALATWLKFICLS